MLVFLCSEVNTVAVVTIIWFVYIILRSAFSNMLTPTHSPLWNRQPIVSLIPNSRQTTPLITQGCLSHVSRPSQQWICMFTLCIHLADTWVQSELHFLPTYTHIREDSLLKDSLHRHEDTLSKPPSLTLIDYPLNHLNCSHPANEWFSA